LGSNPGIGNFFFAHGEFSQPLQLRTNTGIVFHWLPVLQWQGWTCE